MTFRARLLIWIILLGTWECEAPLSVMKTIRQVSTRTRQQEIRWWVGGGGVSLLPDLVKRSRLLAGLQEPVYIVLPFYKYKNQCLQRCLECKGVRQWDAVHPHRFSSSYIQAFIPAPTITYSTYVGLMVRCPHSFSHIVYFLVWFYFTNNLIALF